MNPFYIICRSFVLSILKILFGIKRYGLENIPQEGSFIVASNHSSYLDPLLIGVTFPYELAFAAKKELFKIPIIGMIIRNLNSIPINRKQLDLSSLKAMINKVQKEKKSLVIFPEGTRKKENSLKDGKRGVGFLVQKISVPVIPAYISNTDNKLFSFLRIKKMCVHYGKPIHMEQTEENKKEFSKIILERTLTAIKQIKESSN